MLSLGNFFFSNLKDKSPTESSTASTSLKESYKFYFHVLNEDAKNIYAACGLGMVCAEKGEMEAAREIFAKVCIVKDERPWFSVLCAGERGKQGTVRRYQHQFGPRLLAAKSTGGCCATVSSDLQKPKQFIAGWCTGKINLPDGMCCIC